MMEQMTLSELKTGMHVVLRNGNEGVVFRGGNFEDTIVMLEDGRHSLLRDHNEDMSSAFFRDCDIVKVYDVEPNLTRYMFKFVNGKENEDDDIKLIYAEEEPITRAEAEKLLGRKIVD